MYIVSGRLLDLLTLNNKTVSAMALWPFVIFRDQAARNNPVIINHERIHHRQQLELLILPFYIWYFIEYWTAMFRNGFNHQSAYMGVSFERKAYAFERDMAYLGKRNWLASWPFFLAKLRKINKHSHLK